MFPQKIMEVQKAIIIDSWNVKFSGVTISFKDKCVYTIFHMLTCFTQNIKASFCKLSHYETL